MLNVGNGYYQFSVLHSKLSKVSSLTSKHLPSRPFRGAGVQAQLSWVLCSGSCQAVMEVPVGLCSCLELDWGRVQLQVHSGYYHNSLLCGSMAEDPSFLLGIGWRPLKFWKLSVLPCHVGVSNNLVPSESPKKRACSDLLRCSLM